MTEKRQKAALGVSTIRSGPEVVCKFIEDLSSDSTLDSETIEAIGTLLKANKLTLNSLMRKLEEIRKHSRL